MWYKMADIDKEWHGKWWDSCDERIGQPTKLADILEKMRDMFSWLNSIKSEDTDFQETSKNND